MTAFFGDETVNSMHKLVESSGDAVQKLSSLNEVVMVKTFSFWNRNCRRFGVATTAFCPP